MSEWVWVLVVVAVAVGSFFYGHWLGREEEKERTTEVAEELEQAIEDLDKFKKGGTDE